MSRQILAIDIRNSAIAAVLINAGLKSSAIQSCAFVPFGDASEEPERLQKALATLKEQINSSDVNTVVALPADKAIYRSVHIPFKEDKKIRQVLPFELEPTMPWPIDELVIDYQKPSRQDHNGLLAIATEKRLLQNTLELLVNSQLKPQLVVPGAFPLVIGLMSWEEHFPDQALILDVDTQMTTLFAVMEGQIVLVRSLPAKIDSKSAMETLALKIRQTLTAFAETNAVEYSPTRTYFSGPIVRNDATAKGLAEILNLDAETLDLRQHLPKVETVGDLDSWHSAFMDNALALALLEAEGQACPNFHRSSSQLRNYWINYRPYVMGPAILAAVVLIMGMASVLIDSHMLQKRVDQINAQIEDTYRAAFPDEKKITDPLLQMQGKIKELKKNALEPNQGGTQVPSIDILYEISQRVPKDIDVVFTRMEVVTGAVTISGETAAFNVVDDIKGRLEKSDLFKQVTISSANMDKAGDKVRFRLKIDL